MFKFLIPALAIASYVIYRGIAYKETAENIRVKLSGIPKIHKINFKTLVLSIDLKVDNPSKEQINIQIPSIRLFYNNQLVANTQISDKVHVIAPVSTGKISSIKIETSTVNLISHPIVTDFLAGKDVTKKLGFEIMLEANGIPLKIQKL